MKNAPETEKTLPQTLFEAIRYFADGDNALDFIVGLRWPDGVVRCPRCHHREVLFLILARNDLCTPPLYAPF